MGFDPQDYDVKPIGDAGLTERTVLDGSERILVQGGPDENVDTTPMEFVKYSTIQSKIDTLKGTGWAGQTVKGNADAIAEKENLANKKSTLSENSETYYPNQKAVNDGLATKLDVDSSGNITPAGIYLGGASSANLLDDYEEGTWTPTVSGSGSGIFSSVTQVVSHTSYYVKIGNLVILRTILKLNASHVLASGAGRIYFTGVPFAMSTSLGTGYNILGTGKIGESVEASKGTSCILTRYDSTIRFALIVGAVHAAGADYADEEIGFTLTYKTT